jgi:CHAT domain-containing protein
MSLFYSKLLAGKKKHLALREAQNVMRARVMARYGTDLPFYWGAFVLVGN